MKNATIIAHEPDGWKRAWILQSNGKEVGAFAFRDVAVAYAEDHGYTLADTAPTVAEVAAFMNAEKLDYAPHPSIAGAHLVAFNNGIFTVDADDNHERVADSWLAPVVAEPGKPVPAALMVFTTFQTSPSLTVQGYELREVADHGVYAGAIYPVRRLDIDSWWIGEPCASKADAELAILRHAGKCESCGHDVESVNAGCRDCV